MTKLDNKCSVERKQGICFRDSFCENDEHQKNFSEDEHKEIIITKKMKNNGWKCSKHKVFRECDCRNIFIDFYGRNCDGYQDDDEVWHDCSGWNGKDRRCECGNRRVDWKFDDDFDGVYGEAY